MIRVQTETEVALDYQAYQVLLHDRLLLTLTSNSEGDFVNFGITVTDGPAIAAGYESCQMALNDIGADEGTTIRAQGFDGRAMFARSLTDLLAPEIEPSDGPRHPVEVGR